MVIDLHPPKHVPYNGNRSTSPNMYLIMVIDLYLIMVIDLHPPKHVPYNGNRSTSPQTCTL